MNAETAEGEKDEEDREVECYGKGKRRECVCVQERVLKSVVCLFFHPWYKGEGVTAPSLTFQTLQLWHGIEYHPVLVPGRLAIHSRRNTHNSFLCLCNGLLWGKDELVNDAFLFLELEDLIRQLGDSVDLIISKLMGDLGHGRDHGGRATQQDLDIRRRCGHVFLDHLCIHETHSSSPALGGIVEHIVDLELGVLLGKEVQFRLEEDVVLVHVCENKVNQSLVLGVLDDRSDDLFCLVVMRKCLLDHVIAIGVATGRGRVERYPSSD